MLLVLGVVVACFFGCIYSPILVVSPSMSMLCIICINLFVLYVSFPQETHDVFSFLRNIGFTVNHSFIVTFLFPGLRLFLFVRNKITIKTTMSKRVNESTEKNTQPVPCRQNTEEKVREKGLKKVWGGENG